MFKQKRKSKTPAEACDEFDAALRRAVNDAGDNGVPAIEIARKLESIALAEKQRWACMPHF